MEEFKNLGLSDNTVNILKKKGFTQPTVIQSKVIPILLQGQKDVVGQSQTGTGKTASFALPILETIEKHSKTVRAIILTPTRELAIQVAKEIDSLKWDDTIKVLAIYGGSGIDQQIQKLREGIDIVVGTPGRVMDLQRRNALKLNNIEYAVLDEADEMLNMGFVEDIENILQSAPKDKKMLLFSATMPNQILKIAQNYMREYEMIAIEKSQVVTSIVEQIYYDISAKDRIEGIRRVMDYYSNFHGIIFCNTKSSVDTVTAQLTKMGYAAASLHGDITQSQREKILQQFRDKQVRALVATDVAARGIDVTDLTHVINFSLLQSPESYVHRIGRTGRAGKQGIAITFIMPSERQRLGFVERTNNCTLEKRELPTPKEIIANREYELKKIITNMIEYAKNKPSRHEQLVKELLNENDPEQVVSSLIRYSLKNDLDLSTYKQLSKPHSDEPLPPDADTRRGGNRGGTLRRDRKRRDGGNRTFGGDRRSSERPNRGRSRGKSNDNSPSSRFSGEKSSRGQRENSRVDNSKPPRSERKPRHRDSKPENSNKRGKYSRN